jgi:hypothetical protein
VRPVEPTLDGEAEIADVGQTTRKDPTMNRMTIGVAASVLIGSVGMLTSVTAAGGSPAESIVGPPTGTIHSVPPAEPAGAQVGDLAAANRAAAAFQDVELAEAAGYVSTLDTLGCFEDPARGGMGLHYLNESLVDTTVDATAPEALVYELDADGQITELVAHEYIVPIDVWTESGPPRLFDLDFHQHPVLPLWILHTWIWKDNPMGVFEDFNPRVRPCPDGVPVFGED